MKPLKKTMLFPGSGSVFRHVVILLMISLLPLLLPSSHLVVSAAGAAAVATEGATAAAEGVGPTASVQQQIKKILSGSVGVAPDVPGPFFQTGSHRRVPLQSSAEKEFDDLFQQSYYDSTDDQQNNSNSNKSPEKIAVVATVYQVDTDLRDWLRYHLDHVMFDVAIVFIDAPQDPEKNSNDNFMTVTESMLYETWGTRLLLVRRGDALMEELKTLDKLYRRFGAFYSFEVQARQLLHLGLVADRYKSLGIDWVVHIDVDELWVLPSSNNSDESNETSMTLHSHFAKLNVNGVTQAVYSNLEAVPLTEDLKPNESRFQAITKFLRSELCLSTEEQYYQAVQPVREQRKIGTGGRSHGMYFQGYWAGKMASRVSTGTIVPHDVTRNAIPPEHWDTTSIAVFDDLSGGPVILHYISTGPHAWVRKYKRLGDLSDRSFDPERVDPSFLKDYPGADSEWPIPTRQLEFARVSRDTLKRAPSDDQAVVWYQRNIGLSTELQAKLQQLNMLVEITSVAKVMAKWTDHPEENELLDKLSSYSSSSSELFPASSEAPKSTCPDLPHFQCYVGTKTCCTILTSNAFLFLQHQLGYQGPRMALREQRLKEKEEAANMSGSDEL